MPKVDELAAGQVWTYRDSPDGGTLTVLHVEPHGEAEVVHVRVGRIGHMPFAGEAVAASVVEHVGDEEPGQDWREGYGQWREDAGGVFTIPVAEAVSTVLGVAPPPAEPLGYSNPAAEPKKPTSGYQAAADKVGFVPSLRLSDNLASLAGAVLGGVIGGVAGLLAGGTQVAVIGAIGGLLAGVLLAGVVLAVVNLFRK